MRCCCGLWFGAYLVSSNGNAFIEEGRESNSCRRAKKCGAAGATSPSASFTNHHKPQPQPTNNTHPLAPHTTYHLATTQHTHCYSWSSGAIATNNHTTYNTSACCGCGLVPLNLPLVRQVDKSKLMLLLALVHICSCSQIRLSSSTWLNRSTLVSRADFANLSLKMM